jgi:phosphate transport system substrate-binding protein
MSEIGKAFEAGHPGTRIEVQSGGSGKGILDARQGIADVGMVSRDLKESEADLQHFSFAIDGICMIVNKSNKVAALSEEQVRAIYQQKITNWQQVGGADTPIVVVNKAEGRSTLELFLAYFKMQPLDVKPSVIIGDNAQGIKTVAGNPSAIGYVSVGSAEFEAAHGSAIKLLPLNGVEATVDNVKSKKFPIYRTLNLVTKGKPTGLAKDFIEFATSTAAESKIRAQFFVPLPRNSG